MVEVLEPPSNVPNRYAPYSTHGGHAPADAVDHRDKVLGVDGVGRRAVDHPPPEARRPGGAIDLAPRVLRADEAVRHQLEVVA